MDPREAGIVEALRTFKLAAMDPAARMRAMTFLNRPAAVNTMNAIHSAHLPASFAPAPITQGIRQAYAGSMGKGMMTSADPKVQQALAAARAMHA